MKSKKVPQGQVLTGEMGGTVGDVSSSPIKTDESASKSKCEVMVGAGVAASSNKSNRKERSIG